ncbi:MAG: GNAT family N-acetyltransferase [Anaerolineales bacterium]|nr:GNAT family N-acetyltransferase [Anaerolineales bacterium]
MLRLIPLTENEYAAFYAYNIRDYADAMVRAGNARPDLAEQVAHQQTALVLTNRLASPDQFMFTIHDDALNAPVGYLWWGVRELSGIRVANLYFIGIFEPYRRRGYATQALRLFEEKVRAAGLNEMRLFVFGHNARAWKLYEKTGYGIVSATMAKRIS